MKKLLLLVSLFATGSILFGVLTSGKPCKIGGTPCKTGLECKPSKNIAEEGVHRCQKATAKKKK